MTSYVEEDYIETTTGVAFHFLDPKPEEIKIEDIAWSLSNQCRYTGHVIRFYSVAEHCCHLYDHAQRNGITDKQLLRTLLMHDASEAYLTDIARPIKAHIPDYKRLETAIEKAIATKFDLIYPYPAEIKELDTRILIDERAQAMEPSNNTWGVVAEPLGVKLDFFEPQIAFVNYYARFEECE